MIITVGNTKGGVGKTTVAINLAVARALAGHRVWLVDGDPEASAQTAIGIRADLGQEPGIACSSYADGKTLRTQVLQQKSNFDDVIIDVGGTDSGPLRAALHITDVLLVPFRPRSLDLWRGEKIGSLVESVQAERDGLRAFAFLSQAEPGETADNVGAAEIIRAVPQLDFLDTPLRNRKSFGSAAGAGMSVLEFKPVDRKACAELQALVDALWT